MNARTVTLLALLGGAIGALKDLQMNNAYQDALYALAGCFVGMGISAVETWTRRRQREWTHE